jgi:hypothetical protein
MSDSAPTAPATDGRELPGQATEGAHDVSLLLGGPFFQLLLRAGLIRPSFDLVLRRILVLALVPWVPLLVLTLAAGTALGDAVRVPFLWDIEVHIRFLVAIPLLVLAEREIHDRLRPVFSRFLERDLLAPAEAARFDAILVGARRWRNSYVAEALMILASFGMTPLLWSGHIALDVATWYRALARPARAARRGARPHRAPALADRADASGRRGGLVVPGRGGVRAAALPSGHHGPRERVRREQDRARGTDAPRLLRADRQRPSPSSRCSSSPRR